MIGKIKHKVTNKKDKKLLLTIRKGKFSKTIILLIIILLYFKCTNGNVIFLLVIVLLVLSMSEEFALSFTIALASL